MTAFNEAIVLQVVNLGLRRSPDAKVIRDVLCGVAAG